MQLEKKGEKESGRGGGEGRRGEERGGEGRGEERGGEGEGRRGEGGEEGRRGKERQKEGGKLQREHFHLMHTMPITTMSHVVAVFYQKKGGLLCQSVMLWYSRYQRHYNTGTPPKLTLQQEIP